VRQSQMWCETPDSLVEQLSPSETRAAGPTTGTFARIGAVGLLLATLLFPSDRATAQSAFDQAVEKARAAWLDHDMERLVSGSDTVRLRIPGVAPSASLKPGQAARLLDQYLKPCVEQSFEVNDIRELSDDHAYAEMLRTYVVKGTDQDREEIVLLGFRRINATWLLREVRVTP